MKNTKKILSIFLALLMIITIIPMSSITASAATSGTCGENLTWTFDESTGTLTISGAGAMDEFAYDYRPWDSHKDNIKTVVIGNGVTTIGRFAFAYCTSLENVTIGNDITIIGNFAFVECTSLANIIIPNSVTTIGEHVFYYCTSLANITIGNNVTTIGDGTFSNCTSLAEISFPNSVTTLGSYMLSGCENLTSIIFGDGITEIDKIAFGVLDKLESVVIGDGVTTINDYAFSNCENLKNVIIGNSVTVIGYAAFSFCRSLESVTIGNSVTTIGDLSFAYCTNLTSAPIPNRVTTIGDLAFAYCTNLTSATIPNSVTTIGDLAFAYCTSLPSVTIPDSVTTIDRAVFGGCSSLKSITVDSNNQHYSNDENGVLFNKSKTVLVQYPKGNTRTSYTIPGGVTTIEYCALVECVNLTSVTIPDSITTIVFGAFYDCNNLTDVYYSGTEEQWNKISIDNSENYNDPLLNATIHFLGEETHDCSYVSVVTPPTCTEQGYTTYNCSICGDSYVSDYTDASGHKITTIVLTVATCKQQGMQYDMCEECGKTLSDIVFTPSKEHVLGEWEISVEATENTAGEKVQKCTLCGDIINKETIPPIVNENGNYKVVDEKTGVELEYQKDDYNGDVDIIVEETIDESALNLVDTKTNASNVKLFNITMTVDGVETQPNGTVTIRIPLPAGFNPESSHIIYIDTVTGKIEKFDTTYENGYLVVETTHFSYYAVVEEVVNGYNYTFSIQTPSRTEIRNKDGIILHANIEGTAPKDSYVKWESSNGNFDKSADGSNLKIIAKNKGYTTFTAILCDADGNELARDSVEMYSKSGFFDKIGGFFRSLFGTTKVYDN